MTRKDYFSLMTVAQIYLFVQLFITPLLLSVFENSVLARIIERELYFPLATSFSLESVAISMLVYVCFFCGGLVRLPRLTYGVEEFDWHSPRIVRIFWVIFVIGYPLKLARAVIDGDIPSGSVYYSLFGDTAEFFMLLNWFHMVALPFLAIAYYENSAREPRIARYYPLVLLCYLCVGALNGSTFALIFPFAIHLAIRQRYRPVGGFGLFVLALIVVGIIYLKIFMKVIIIDDPDNQMSIFAPLAFLVNRVSVSFVVFSIVDNPTFTYGYGMFEQFMYNFKVPGYEYAVPDGNAFGRYYSIINSHDYATSMAVSVVGDLILHLGVFGASLGMFVVGVLYRGVSSLSTADSKLSWIIYAMLWPIMVHGLESPASVLSGTVVRMIFLCVACYFVGRLFLVSPDGGGLSGFARGIFRRTTSK